MTRAPYNNAEIIDLNEGDDGFDDIRKRIRAAVEEAKQLETESFRIYETTNLKVLENRSCREPTCASSHHCHMQFFRQVLSPLGMYNCPVYRNQPHGCVGPKDAYATTDEYDATRGRTAGLIESFDAHHECREVTCLYNHVNWWIEDLVRHPEEARRDRGGGSRRRSRTSSSRSGSACPRSGATRTTCASPGRPSR